MQFQPICLYPGAGQGLRTAVIEEIDIVECRQCVADRFREVVFLSHLVLLVSLPVEIYLLGAQENPRNLSLGQYR